MKRAKIKICELDGCKNPSKSKDVFCSLHYYKVTVNRFLTNLYFQMNRRVKTGVNTGRPDLYLGLPILPKDAFLSWSKNHPDFISAYKRWFSNDFDRKLTPTVNRMNSSRGYVLGNIEWMTNSQNCGLSGEVRKMKQKKAIYDLLGVSNGKK